MKNNLKDFAQSTRRTLSEIFKKIFAFVAHFAGKIKSFACQKITFVGRKEFLIPVIAFAAWLFFAVGGMLFGWTTYPVGYFQKLTFGIFGMSIISGVAWIWLGATFPDLKKCLDPDTMEYQSITTWEKIKLAFWLYAWYSGGAVFLASLY